MEFVSREEKANPPMTMIESHQTTGIPIPTNRHDDEFGEGIVKLFIAKANRMRRAQGLSDLCVGALAFPDLRCMMHVDAEMQS